MVYSHSEEASGGKNLYHNGPQIQLAFPPAWLFGLDEHGFQWRVTGSELRRTQRCCAESYVPNHCSA